MELILLEKVNKLGIIGDIVNVKNGYARNFLIPTGKAIRATEANKKAFEHKKLEIAKNSSEKKSQAEAILAKLPRSVVIIRQAGDDGKLFGSVAARDIANAVNESQDFGITRSQIELPSVVKFIGTHQANVVLHPEVICSIKLIVSRTVEEATEMMDIEE